VRSGTILVVDDERGIREMLQAVLQDEGLAVTAVGSGEEALSALSRELFDLILLDVWLPGMDGLEVMRQVHAAGHRMPIVMISGHASAELAARAVREGALDFIEKPLSLERVLVSVRNALTQARLVERLASERGEEVPVLSGVSPAVVALRKQILQAAPTDARVLITGPNGSGKEVVAWLVHHHSRRADGPFVAVNCAAIPSELIESELFGHLKGAFTGAVESKRGKFELADGGTLFLDEIGDMSPLTQAKVLRVLQESSFTRVGGSQEVRVDVRVIAATNKDLEEEIAAGRFREDLFFRLNVIPLRVPPVAERREDVPLLVDEFIRQFARRDGMPPKRVSAAAMAKLQAADWSGNVREIRNVVERLVVMVPDDEIQPDHLDLRPGVTRLALPTELLPLKEARARFERGYIEQVVEACGGNMSQAAKVLGLERSHLYRKLRALGVRER